MPTLVIDKNSFMRGMKSDRIGIANTVEALPGFYARSNGIDLHRVGYEGQPTTAQVFGAGSISHANINSIPRAVAVDITAATPNVYWMLGGLSGTAPRVVEIISNAYDSTVVTITADGGHNFTTLPGTSRWGYDLALYRIGTTYYVLYSWRDSGDGDVGRFDLGGANPNDSFLSGSMTHSDSGTKLSSNLASHYMAEGADGRLYITNGRYVAQVDGAVGTNGTVHKTRYDLGVGWIAQDVRAYGNFLAVGAIRSGTAYVNYTFTSKCRVNLWNMTEPGLGLVYEIDDTYLSALYVHNNRLFAWTSGRNNTIKLWEFNGQGFTLRWENAVFTTLPDHGQIEVYKNLLCWASDTGGMILAFDLETNGVHTPFLGNDGATDVTTFGFLKNITQSNLYMGGIHGSTYKASWLTLSSTNYATGSRDLRTRNYPLSFKATITGFRFFFGELASSASCRFSLFRDFNDTDVTGSTDLLNTLVDNATYGDIAEFELQRTIVSVSSFWMNLRLAGQVSVRRIEIDYELLR